MSQHCCSRRTAIMTLTATTKNAASLMVSRYSCACIWLRNAAKEMSSRIIHNSSHALHPIPLDCSKQIYLKGEQ